MDKATWWLEKAIRLNEQRRKTPRGMQLILVVKPGSEAEVAAAARRVGARVLGTVTGAVLVDVPDPSYIDALSGIPGVESIAYNAPVAPMETYLEKLVMTVASITDPLLRNLTPSELHMLGIKAFVDRETVARALLTPKLPLLGAPPLVSRELLGEYKIIPTSVSRRFLGVPSGASISTKVAVIDSGVSPDPALRKFVMQYVLTLEAPGDYMGHGEWCTSAAFGNAWPFTLHGRLEPVVDAKHVTHYKVFTAFGPTSTFQVMKAMELAAKHGAKVVSMSLGGPLQDRVDRQPDARAACIYSKMYGTIYVVAAGNDGPDRFTISSPGASPCAVTVASISLTDNAAAWWSSRGPQGGYYKDHPGELQEDIARYGESFMLKPTVHAPGGGRAQKDASPDEVIYSGCTGWFELLAPYDHTPGDGLCGMHGTCVVGDTMVKTEDGWVEIRNLEIGDRVVAASTEPRVGLAFSKVAAKYERPPTDVYVLRLEGRELWATGDHPVLVVRKLDRGFSVEWLTIEQLASMRKDELSRIRVVSMRRQPMDGGRRTIGRDMAWFLGYFLGDGWVTKMNRTYMIAIADAYDSSGQSRADVLRAVELARQLFGLNMKLLRHKKGARYWRAFSKAVGEKLIELGVAGKRASEKTIPAWVFALPVEEKIAFLEGLIAADGYCDRHGRCRIETSSKALAHSVHLLAIDVGANVSRVYSRTRRIRVPSTGREVTATTYIVQLELPAVRTYRRITVGKTSFPFSRMDDTVDLRKIVGIEYAGRERTYDITVPGYHSFVANGIVVHNSQATPHAAGLIAYLVDRGVVASYVDVVRRAAAYRGVHDVALGWAPARVDVLAG